MSCVCLPKSCLPSCTKGNDANIRKAMVLTLHQPLLSAFNSDCAPLSLHPPAALDAPRVLPVFRLASRVPRIAPSRASAYRYFRARSLAPRHVFAKSHVCACVRTGDKHWRIWSCLVLALTLPLRACAPVRRQNAKPFARKDAHIAALGAQLSGLAQVCTAEMNECCGRVVDGAEIC